MDTSSKYNIPWEIIAESLTDNLTVEGELQLKQWLSSDLDNKRKFLQIQELWKNGMEDYEHYQTADENEAWKSLQSKLGNGKSKNNEAGVIQVNFAESRHLLRRYLAIAAVFAGLIGLGIWFMLTRNAPAIYETADNVQKKILLDDGSAVTLRPGSKIIVPHYYNRTKRTITMASGEAYFEIEHLINKPFIVEMGTTQIKDIGTSFIIKKNKNEINVSVSTGKVQFLKLATRESRDLSAGTGITFNVRNESFGEIKSVTLMPGSNDKLLNFENAPLSDVIILVQKIYGKKIILNDSALANKKITAQLDGMKFDKAMKVICKSLDLKCTVEDSVYILKLKN